MLFKPHFIFFWRFGQGMLFFWGCIRTVFWSLHWIFCLLFSSVLRIVCPPETFIFYARIHGPLRHCHCHALSLCSPRSWVLIVSLVHDILGRFAAYVSIDVRLLCSGCGHFCMSLGKLTTWLTNLYSLSVKSYGNKNITRVGLMIRSSSSHNTTEIA